MSELRPGQVTRPIDINRLGELANAKLALLDSVCDLSHDLEYELHVGDIFLHSDDALAHLLLHAARANFRGDVGERLYKLGFRDPVQRLGVNVVEKLVDVLHSGLDLHCLHAFNEILFRDASCGGLFVAAEDVKDPLKSDIVVLLDFLNLSAGRG